MLMKKKKSKEVSPTFDEINKRTKKLAAANPKLVKVLTLGKSDKGKTNLPFVKITDPSVPEDEKQIVLITGGTHGSEETGRATVMAFAEWLVKGGQTHLSTQSFYICTCLNPDGAKLNTYHNGNDVNIYESCKVKVPGATTSEARAILEVAYKIIPNCCVDVHGLSGGGIGDSEYVTPGLTGNISAQVGIVTAYEMNQAASSAGFPQRDPYIPAYQSDPNHGIPWVKKTASELGTLSFTIEITEHTYPLEESVRSGFERLKRLVEIGERVQWYQPYAGYPADIITNNSITALMPHGKNAGERRRSRKELMQAVLEDGIWGVKRTICDRARGLSRTAEVNMVCREELKSYPNRFTLQALLDRRSRVKGVEFNGKKLKPGQVHGFEERITTEGRFIRANIYEKPKKGDNILKIFYTMPVLPHDPVF